MGYETINSGDMPDKLNEAWPLDGDPMGAGAIHLRGLKTVVKNSHKSTLTQSALMMEMQQAFNNQEFEASGFVHKGRQMGANGVVNQGINTWISAFGNNRADNSIWLGRTDSIAVGTSETAYAVVNIAGVITKLLKLSDSGARNVRIKFPQAEDGKRTFDTATGTSVVHAGVAEAFAAETATNEVVTDRVDMWGIEQWKEEITAAHPMMYGNGVPQSLATTVDGIATEVDSTRPVTYFAQFEGDTTSRGRGINTATIGFANLAKLMSNPDHKMYYTADSKLEQIRNRIRTFAGAGNGDWVHTDVTATGSNYSAVLSAVDINKAMVQCHGAYDNVFGGSSLSTSHGGRFVTYGSALPDAVDNRHKGLYSASAGSAISVDKTVHFLVCGTVNRLNQGAYHPSHNPKGAGRWQRTTGSSASSEWYSDLVTVPQQTSLDAFSYGIYGGIVTGSNGLGRPDGRFYDGICAGGQGGVCRDMRYSARKLTLEDYAEADLQVKAGVHRGFEKEVFTIVRENTPNTTNGNSLNITNIADTSLYKVGDIISLVNAAGLLVVDNRPISLVSKGSSLIQFQGTGYVRTAGELYHIIHTKELSTSVGGEFLQADVIGSPANLKAVFPQGFAGRWMGDFDGSSASTFEFTRKSLDTSSNGVNSSDVGGTWAASTPAIGSATNDSTFGAHNKVGRIGVYPYTAFAKQTKPSVNAKVLGGKHGLSDVMVTSSSIKERGVLLAESLLGEVLTSVAPDSSNEYALLSNYIVPSTGMLTNGAMPTHTQSALGAPTNNSPALKVLPYNINSKGMGSLNFIPSKLTYSSGWDDTGTIDPSKVQHTLAEPIGWA